MGMISIVKEIPLDIQIESFNSNQKKVVHQLITEKKLATRKKLKETADYFANIIDSLNELKARRERDTKIELSLSKLYDELNPTEFSKDTFLEFANKIMQDKKETT